MLRIGRIEADEWNEKIIPAIKNRILKERKDLISSGFLVVYQKFESVIQDEDGILYNCNAWNPPNSTPYVEVTEY